jgi:hypothetical protein
MVSSVAAAMVLTLVELVLGKDTARITAALWLCRHGQRERIKNKKSMYSHNSNVILAAILLL